MFDLFWLFFVVVFRSSAETAKPAAPADPMQHLFGAEECARGTITPC